MALMLIVRVFVAVLDLVNALILGLGIGLAAFQAFIIIFGAASIVKLFNLIKTAEKSNP
jgi:hypothetical protein